MEDIEDALKQGDDDRAKALLSEYRVSWDDDRHLRDTVVWENIPLIRTFAKYANTTMIIHLLEVGLASNYVYRIKWLIREFAAFDKIDRIDWIMKWSEDRGIRITWVGGTSTMYGIRNTKTLDCLYGYGWAPSCDDIRSAMHSNNLVVCKWCFEHGFTQIYVQGDLMGLISREIPFSREMLQLLHTYSIKGVYQMKCRAGKCPVCREIALCELWEMDYAEFENRVQWLPREMVEDIGTLI